MTRIKVALNKPKNAEYYIKKAQEIAAKNGEEIEFNVKTAAKALSGNVTGAAIDKVKHEIEKHEGKPETDPKTAKKLVVKAPKKEDIPMRYSCGACHNPLSGQVEQCPKCGAFLHWK
jgi:hypothetical protein